MANTGRNRVKLTGGSARGSYAADLNGHEPIVRLQAARKYTARCSCGWRGRVSFPSSEAARAEWAAHVAPDDDLFTSGRVRSRKVRRRKPRTA